MDRINIPPINTNIKPINTKKKCMEKKLVDNLLHKELSYQVHGAAIEVRKDFGPGHKEKLYQEAFAKELDRRNVAFQKEPAIKIYAPKDGKYIGLYRPDFIVDEKMIVETKAEKFVRQDEIKRMYDYLRNSRYELAYLINFASQKLFVRRVIFTNDRKPFNKPLNHTNTGLKNTKRLLVSIGLLLVLFSGVRSADAATLYFDAPNSVLVGDDFEVSLLLDPEGETINAVEGKVRFTETLLEVSRINTGDSLVDLWVVPPRKEDGAIVFSGITPGGFSGIQEAGSGTLLPGVVATFIVRGESAGTALFSLSESRVLAHDGLGTPLLVVLKSKEIKISGKRPAFAEASAGKQETSDTTPPEPFTPMVVRDGALFDGAWALIFTADDSGSGIAYYEVYESTRRYGPGDLPREDIAWARALSPYLLADQTRGSYIYVKATDNEGNIRIIRVAPQTIIAFLVDKLVLLLSAVGIMVTLLLIVFFKQKYPTKKR